MNTRLILSSLYLSVWLFSAFGASNRTETPQLSKRPKVQETISKAVRAGHTAKRDKLQETVQPYVDDLNSLTDGDRVALLKQMALYLAEADSEAEVMGGSGLLGHLKFSNEEKIQAALDLLAEQSPAMQEVVRDGILCTVDRPQGREPDFSPYLPVLRKQKRVSGLLIQYMYEVSPEKAKTFLQRNGITVKTPKQEMK